MLEVQEIEVEKIAVGDYDRRVSYEGADFDLLVASIRRLGIIEPLVVSKTDEAITLVAGHRRLEAAKHVGLKSVPAMVIEGQDAKRTEVGLAENIFRKDLTPVELASAIRDIVEGGTMTAKEVGIALHRSEFWVHQQIAMLAWPADVLEAVHDDEISVTAAANLAEVADNSYRAFLLRSAVENGATARTTAAWLQAYRAAQPPDVALAAEPVAGKTPAQPLIPQVPCFACGQVFRQDCVSHLPLCGGCIAAIRNV